MTIKATKGTNSIRKKFVSSAFGIIWLLLVGLAGCGRTADPLLQMRELDLATRVRWVLPPNWTLEEHDHELIISRKNPVKSHNCIGLDLSWMRHRELLKQFVDKSG